MSGSIWSTCGLEKPASLELTVSPMDREYNGNPSSAAVVGQMFVTAVASGYPTEHICEGDEISSTRRRESMSAVLIKCEHSSEYDPALSGT
ncbi:hypothetical protein STEG23_028098, partial [Scotinomys teguina]